MHYVGELPVERCELGGSGHAIRLDVCLFKYLAIEWAQADVTGYQVALNSR
jgi:hypothetical protein